MSNQNYYYYYAINNPSNANDPSKNIYRRLPIYITPPLEHSSIIAVPKDIPKLSLNSPELSDSDLLSNPNNKKSEQIVITKEELNQSSSPSLSPTLSPTNIHSNQSIKGYPSPSYSPSISSINKATQTTNIFDMSSLTLNNSSFTQTEPNLLSSSPPPVNSYDYLKDYAIHENVDDLLKNQTYNNIVLDKDKSRSAVDMKSKLNHKLEPSSKWNSNLNLSRSHSSSSQTHSPSSHHHRHHHPHHHHYYSNRQSSYDTDEKEDENQSIISSTINELDESISMDKKTTPTTPALTASKPLTKSSKSKSNKHVSLPPLNGMFFFFFLFYFYFFLFHYI